MGPRAMPLAASVVALLVCALLFWWWYTEHKRNERPNLTVPWDALDFGEVWAGRDFVWKLPVQNTSPRPVLVRGMRVQCGCVSIEPLPVTIGPGDVCEFRVRLDLTSDEFAFGDRNVARFRTSIVPIVEGCACPLAAWTLHGVVRRALRVSTRRVDFGDSLVEGGRFGARAFKVKIFVPNVALSARAPREVASVRVRPLNSPLWDYEVEVTPMSNLSIGKHVFTVDLSVRCGDGDLGSADAARSLVFPVEVVATVHPPVVAVPGNLFLGAGVLGEYLEEWVTLSSPVAPFTVSSVQCFPPRSVVVAPCGIPTSEFAQRFVYRIGKEISEGGRGHGRVLFAVQMAGAGQSFVIPVQVSYEGVNVQ